MSCTDDRIAYFLFVAIFIFIVGYMAGGRDKNDAE
jgi:hypothetical protein